MSGAVASGPSLQTQALVSRYRVLSVGDTVEWAELEQLTGLPRAKLYAYDGSARRILEREAMHFETTPGHGVMRISHAQVVERTMPRQRGSLRRVARKMVRTGQATDMSQLDQSQRATALAHQTSGKMHMAIGSEAHVRKLSGEIQQAGTMLPLDPKEACRRFLGG